MDELQKSRFLALYSMVLADGIVEANELDALYRIGRESYHLTPEEINKYIVSAGSSFVAPDSMEGRITILYEMSEIAWADGTIDPSEKSLLLRYVKRLGFKDENADEIADYMLKQVEDKVSKEEVINSIINA